MQQVGEHYVFTVADSAAIDSSRIMVEAEGHNALSDFNGPAKVHGTLRDLYETKNQEKIERMNWCRFLVTDDMIKLPLLYEKQGV